MARLTRFTQKLFGSTASANRIAKFGSLAAGSPVAYSGSTVTPANVQSLSNFLSGLDGSLVAGSTTPIQDMNALHYLWSYQLAYIMQAGVAEYDSGTTYYTNSLVQYSGTVYISTADNNTGNTPTSGSPWSVFQYARQTPTRTVLTSGSGTYTTPAGVTYLRVRLQGAGGGGGCSGTATGTAATAGSSTTLGTYSALGGSPAIFNSPAGGAGGSTSGIPAGSITIVGAFGNAQQANGGSGNFSGGMGGVSPFGGAGAGTEGGATAGKAAATNSGSGGGGAGGSSGAGQVSGGGGGAGGYAEILISSPSASYSYSVGTGGNGGGLGTSGVAGGNGGSGLVIIDEFYN